MKIVDKIKAKQAHIVDAAPVTIAFIGDSVTQGCFECYKSSSGNVETVFDYRSAYSTRVREILNLLYPTVQINIINSGISGDNARGGAKRLERDVLSYKPDLVVVSCGLNDSMSGMEALEGYTTALDSIFSRLTASGTEAVFLTENYMNTEISCHLKEDCLVLAAERCGSVQQDGTLDAYFDAARALAGKYKIPVCDVRAAWKTLFEAGVNVTELLANKINHPIREIHSYMAIKIIETILA